MSKWTVDEVSVLAGYDLLSRVFSIQAYGRSNENVFNWDNSYVSITIIDYPVTNLVVGN